MSCDCQIISQHSDGAQQVPQSEPREEKRNILDISAQKWYELNLKKGFEGDRYLLPRPDFVGSCLNWPVKMSYLTQVKIYDDMEAKGGRIQDQNPSLPNQAVKKSPYVDEYNKLKGKKPIKYSKIAAVGKKTALAAWKAVSSMPGYRFEGDVYGIPRPSGDEENPISYDDILNYRQAIEEHKLKIQQERQRKIQEREDAIRKKYTNKFMTALRIEYNAVRHVTEDMMKTGVDRIVNELIKLDRERGDYTSPFKLEKEHRKLTSNLFGSASKTKVSSVAVPTPTSAQGPINPQPQTNGSAPKQGTISQVSRGGQSPFGRNSISHSSQLNRPVSRDGQLQRPVQSNGAMSRDRPRHWPTQTDSPNSRGGQPQRSVQTNHGNWGRQLNVTSNSASRPSSQLQRPLQSSSVASAGPPREWSPPVRMESSITGRQMTSPQNPAERNTVTNIQAPTWRQTLRDFAWSSPRPGSQPHRSESIGVPRLPPRAVQSHVRAGVPQQSDPITRTVPFNNVPGVSISVPGTSNNREHRYVSPISFYVSPGSQTNWNRNESRIPVLVPGHGNTGTNVSPQRPGQRNMGVPPKASGQKNRGASVSPQRPQQKHIATGVSPRKPGQKNRGASISPQRSDRTSNGAKVSPQKQGQKNRKVSVSPQRPNQKNNAANASPQGPGNKNRGASVSPQRSDKRNNGASVPTQKPGHKSISPQRPVKKNMGAGVSSQKTVQKNREASNSPERPVKTNNKIKVLHQKQVQKNREASISPQRQGKQNVGKSVPLRGVGQQMNGSPQRAEKRKVEKRTSPRRAEQKKSGASVPLQRVKGLHSR